MKTKTIKKILREKLDDFAESIENEAVKKMIKKNTIITGGAIASMLMQESINDFDIYFKDKQTVIAVAEYFCEKAMEEKKIHMEVLYKKHPIVQKVLGFSDITVKSMNNIVKNQVTKDNDGELNFYSELKEFDLGELNKDDDKEVLGGLSITTLNSIRRCFQENPERVKIYQLANLGGVQGDLDDEMEEDETEERKKYSVQFISANAITLSDKIQMVVRFYGEPEEIHENYDFVHVMNYWTSWDNKLVNKVEALESLMGKYLIYKGSKYPLASIFRTRKFINRGFRIDAGQYLKMAFQLNELDLRDPYVLEEQLTGVDMLYFQQIINQLAVAQVRDENFSYGTEYIIKVVEKIFE